MKLERKDLSFYPEDVLEYQMNRYERTANDFKAAFSYEAQAVFSAPGRSEICGNHTDHNLGKAVGASVNLDIIAFAAKRDDGKICIKANGFDDINVDIADLEMRDDEKNSSSALVRGCAESFPIWDIKSAALTPLPQMTCLKAPVCHRRRRLK